MEGICKTSFFTVFCVADTKNKHWEDGTAAGRKFVITHYYQFNNGACSFFIWQVGSFTDPPPQKRNFNYETCLTKPLKKLLSKLFNYLHTAWAQVWQYVLCSIFLFQFCNILTIWQIILDWRKNCQKSRNVPQQIQNEMAITCRSWRVFFKIHPDSDFLSH